MTTIAQNENFTKVVLPIYPLDEAIKWIAHNLEPEDVFSPKQLSKWAEDSGWSLEG